MTSLNHSFAVGNDRESRKVKGERTKERNEARQGDGKGERGTLRRVRWEKTKEG